MVHFELQSQSVEVAVGAHVMVGIVHGRTAERAAMSLLARQVERVLQRVCGPQLAEYAREDVELYTHRAHTYTAASAQDTTEVQSSAPRHSRTSLSSCAFHCGLCRTRRRLFRLWTPSDTCSRSFCTPVMVGTGAVSMGPLTRC